MKRCPACGAEYDVTDAICPHCGAELPAPYDGWDGEQEEADDGYDGGDFPNPVPAEEDEGRTILSDGSVWQLAGQQTLPPAMLTILSGAEVILEEESICPGSVVLAQGRIISIQQGVIADPEDGATFVDLTGKTLAPGFIDVHTHGMMGYDTNEADGAALQRLSLAAARYGVTALLPTTVACGAAELSRVLQHIHQAREQGVAGARILGAHLESNFISPQFKGAQPPETLLAPDDPSAWPLRQLIDEYAADIRIITVAPEVPGALELISWLRERGIIVSLGHSAASYEQAVAGFDAGASHVTHLFNAMAPLHHRAPGLVGAALENDEVFTEVISDGLHIHPALLATIFSAKGADRVMVVSDSLRGAGMGAGEFTLGGQHVTVHDNVAQLDNGTIAGSVTTMDAMVRLLVSEVGWDLGEVFLMVATTPANGLGLKEIGRIAPGAIADLVVLDEELQVETTYVGGKVVYQAGS